MILVVEAFVAALAGEPLVRFADDADGSRAELARLERRYLMGQQAGGDPQAGWLRRRIAELRALLDQSPSSQRSSK